MKYLTSFFFLFLFISTYAQKRVVIKSAETKQPLAFATAECFEKSWGRYSDSDGAVVIPDNIWNSSDIVFSYVGYESLTVGVKGDDEIFLSLMSNRMNDVSVKNCKDFKVEKIEVRNRKVNFSLGYDGKSNGQMWAVYVPNKGGKSGMLQSLSFGAHAFHKESKLDAPIRIRLFLLDSSSNLPGAEITNEIISLTPGKPKWLTFNLKEYHLQIPSNGVVVAFEMYDAGPQFHFTTIVDTETKKTREMYGWDIVAIRNDKVLGFVKSPGGAWRTFKHKAKENAAPQVSLGIKVCKD